MGKLDSTCTSPTTSRMASFASAAAAAKRTCAERSVSNACAPRAVAVHKLDLKAKFGGNLLEAIFTIYTVRVLNQASWIN